MKNPFTLIVLFFLFTTWNTSAQNFAWARQHGTNDSSPYGCFIGMDNAGNIYVTGSFAGTVDFDPGPSVLNMTASGYRDCFITKFDGSGNFIWARQIGGTSSSAISQAIAIDGNGNIYTTGYFFGTVDFNPGAGVNTISSMTVNSDIFISKLDSAGNYIWAKPIAGFSFKTALAITTNVNGDIYLTGYFTGTTDFNTGPGVYNLIPVGGTNSFACRLNAAGDLIWAKQLGRGTLTVNTNCKGYAIAVDSDGSVYTTGTFADTADFDPDTTTYNLITIPSTNFDIYLSKLDSSGNFVYAKQMGSTYAGEEAHGLCVDAAGNAYITGNFGDTADFDPGAGTYNLIAQGASDIFTAKYDATGNLVWAKAAGGLYNDFSLCIVQDNGGNVYTTGNFGGPADFDPGAAVYSMTPLGNADGFISKLDSNGNLVWAKQIGGSGNDYGYSLLDAAANIYLTGNYFGTCDFDPGAPVYNLPATGGYDVFIEKIGSGPMGIAASNPASFSVEAYPNPSSGVFSIESLDNMEQITITNPAGQIVYSRNSAGRKISVQLKNAGVYFMRLKSGTALSSRKVIVY
jgi:hypothetical protein